MQLVEPTIAHLPSYRQALERGWSPDNLRPEVARAELEAIDRDAGAFLARLLDREGMGTFLLPDGTRAQRLPGYHRWMWDGEFCGSINFRWQPGTTDLPWYCLGHIGFGVVPWNRRKGYATRALALLLPEVRTEGLEWAELTTDVTNVASQRVIEANGGRLVERFQKPAVYGGAESLRYRIYLFSENT